ncbi:MAG: hypothetical protein V3W41_15095 [Planctomycetota bacterium]
MILRSLALLALAGSALSLFACSEAVVSDKKAPAATSKQSLPLVQYYQISEN